MKQFYLTIYGDDKILYEAATPKLIKMAALDYLADGVDKISIHNRHNGKVITLPEPVKENTVSRSPYVTVNSRNNPCYLWRADNPQRNDSAEYDLRTDELLVCGRVIDKHPVFRGIKPFREFVLNYLVACMDGFDPHKELSAMKDIAEMAGYINRNHKTWQHEIFPYLEKYGWKYSTFTPDIIGRQDNRLLAVSVKGLATILTDNNRLALVEKLQYRVRQTGLPVNVMAERSGIPASNIYKILRGTYNPSLDLLEKLADTVGMKIDLVVK